MSINRDAIQRIMHKVRCLPEADRDETINELMRQFESAALAALPDWHKPHITERIKKKAPNEGEVQDA
jgi:hypothetical protein